MKPLHAPLLADFKNDAASNLTGAADSAPSFFEGSLRGMRFPLELEIQRELNLTRSGTLDRLPES